MNKRRFCPEEEEPFLKNIKRTLTINLWLWLGISAGILQGVALYIIEWFHVIPQVPK